MINFIFNVLIWGGDTRQRQGCATPKLCVRKRPVFNKIVGILVDKTGIQAVHPCQSVLQNTMLLLSCFLETGRCLTTTLCGYKMLEYIGIGVCRNNKTCNYLWTFFSYQNKTCMKFNNLIHINLDPSAFLSPVLKLVGKRLWGNLSA